MTNKSPFSFCETMQNKDNQLIELKVLGEETGQSGLLINHTTLNNIQVNNRSFGCIYLDKEECLEFSGLLKQAMLSLGYDSDKEGLYEDTQAKEREAQKFLQEFKKQIGDILEFADANSEYIFAVLVNKAFSLAVPDKLKRLENLLEKIGFFDFFNSLSTSESTSIMDDQKLALPFVKDLQKCVLFAYTKKRFKSYNTMYKLELMQDMNTSIIYDRNKESWYISYYGTDYACDEETYQNLNLLWLFVDYSADKEIQMMYDQLCNAKIKKWDLLINNVK